jgi:uncharacterized membrane protein YtjA (UPF0391 family)
MLGWAIVLFSLAMGAPALDNPDFATSALRIAQVLFIGWMACGLIALAFHRPIDRRVLHREATSV